MNVNLPEPTTELAAVLRRQLNDLDGSGPAELFAALQALGVIDLASHDSADPANAQLNVVVALEEIARAGRRVPVAETIWVRARGTTPDGFVAIASGVAAGDERVLPYGAFAASLGTVSGAGRVTVAPVPTGVRAVSIDVDDGHLWCPAPDAGPPFVELDPGYVWRTTAAATVGAMAAATDMACEHARTREQFGRPIGSFQALQFRLAECQWRLLGLRLLVREAAWRADRDDPRALVVSALAWLYAREVGRLVTRHVHQVFGAIGFTRELGLTTLTGATAASHKEIRAKLREHHIGDAW